MTGDVHMTDKKRTAKKFAFILIAVNVFITFVFAGMPKENVFRSIERTNFYKPPMHTGQVFYRVLSDVTLNEINGSEVHFSKGTEIGYWPQKEEIDRALDEERTDKDGVRIRDYIISEAVFKDAKVFENITDEVYAKDNERVRLEKEKESKLVRKKLISDLIWFVYPFDGMEYYKTAFILGLVFGLATLITDVFIYLKLTDKAVRIYAAMITVKLVESVLYVLLFKI